MANDVKLLLVDDNPMVLAMLQQALTPFARVVAAGDTADALLKAVDDPPDLVVCDYRMPGMDGRQLVEKLKSRPATANFSAVLMASRTDIDERLSPQDAADDYLVKPFFLKDATRRIKRTVDRIALEKMAKTAPSDGVVRGNLSQMNVIDLMQSLEMGRKSCQATKTQLRGRQMRGLLSRRTGQARDLRFVDWRRSCLQSSTLDWRQLRTELRRQNRSGNHQAQHPGIADGGLAAARRVAARRRRRARAR